MTFAQLHDGFYRNPKVQAAGSVAAWMWAASIGYASEGLTDGFIPLAALASLCPDLDTKPRLKVAARLVEVGLWEVADGGWRVHDYLKWNFSKSAVLAKREATLARVNKHRNGPRHGEGNAVVMRSNASSNAGCNGVTPPVTSGVRNTTPSDPTSSEGSKEPLSPVPPAPTTPPLELTPPKEKAPRKAAKPPADPPPFDPLAAYEAIASTASGRFAVGQKSEWDGGHVIRARVLIRKFPDLATWSLVGAWLASGVMSFRGTLSVGWVAKSFAESVTLARDWDAKGRPADGANRAPDPYAPKPAPVARVVTPSTVNADLDAYMAGMEKKR